jgi:hypothetical protein
VPQRCGPAIGDPKGYPQPRNEGTIPRFSERKDQCILSALDNPVHLQAVPVSWAQVGSFRRGTFLGSALFSNVRKGDPHHQRERGIMSRVIFAGLATLALVASAASAAAQGWVRVGFEECRYGGRYSGSWGHSPYSSGPSTSATRQRSTSAALRGHHSGFYLVGSRYDTDDPYRSSGSLGFGWPDNGWRRRLPMH